MLYADSRDSRVVEVAESSWHAATIDAPAIEVADDGNWLDHKVRGGKCRKRREEKDFHLEILDALM